MNRREFLATTAVTTILGHGPPITEATLPFKLWPHQIEMLREAKQSYLGGEWTTLSTPTGYNPFYVEFIKEHEERMWGGWEAIE